MDIISTIIPIFTIILIGWGAHKKGIIPATFIAPANRLVYYLAIPAMIFKSVAQTDFSRDFNLPVIFAVFAPMLIIFAVAWTGGRCAGMGGGRLATFVQTSFHCNIGYMALAVAYYYLGNDGFARAGIIAGFLMILQNFLSVFILQAYQTTGQRGRQMGKIASKVLANPIILSAAAGIACSLAKVSLPTILLRSLEILSGLALPTALLIIGASLSFSMLRYLFVPVVVAGTLKLVVMPGLGLFIFHALKMTPSVFLPGLILIASPSATVVYIMAKEMNGDTDLAVAAISATTLLSSLSFSLWLTLAAAFG